MQSFLYVLLRMKLGVELFIRLALETEQDMQYMQLMHILQKVATPGTTLVGTQPFDRQV